MMTRIKENMRGPEHFNESFLSMIHKSEAIFVQKKQTIRMNIR